MRKKLIVFVLIFSMGTMAVGSPKTRKHLLREGLVLVSVDGKLIASDANDDRWFFKFDSDINDDRGKIRAGTAVEMLRSASLEKMIAHNKENPGAGYRLYNSVVTKYNDKNFIFPDFFLPISDVKKPTPSTTQKSTQPTEPTINDPNDALAIPDEILAKLKTRKIIRPEQPLKGLELKQNFVLADRTGFLRPSVMRKSTGDKTQHQPGADRGYRIFAFDAIGRNIQNVSFRLLPCEALERALHTQSSRLEPVRFKVAGIVTKYKGRVQHLILLAMRVR